MADPKASIWGSLDKSYAGLADDNFLGSEGTFVYSENIDNFRNPKGIQLSTKVEQIYALGETNPRRYLITRFGIEMVFFNQKIFANGTLIYTLGWADSFRNAIEFGNYIVVTFSTGTVDTFVAGATTLNESLTDESIDLVECGYMLIYNNATMPGTPIVKNSVLYRFYGTTASIELITYLNNAIFIAAGCLIYRMDTTQLVTPPATPWWPFPIPYAYPPILQLMLGIVVQNMTQFLDQFRVYCNVANTHVNQSYLFLVNIGSLALNRITQTVDLKDIYIRWVVNDWEQDRVIAGSDDTNSELWIMSGTQKQLVNRERPITNQAFRYYTNMLYRADYTLFKTYFVGAVNLTDGTLITLSGKRYNGYPLETNGWVKGAAFSLVSKKNNHLILGDPDGKIYKVYMGNDSGFIKYNSSGYLISRKFYGNHIGNVKDTEILQFGYELPANTTITVQLSFNWWAYTTLRTLSWAADQAKKTCIIYKNSISKLVTTEWNYVQMKLILATSSESATPVVYDGMMLFTEWLRDTLWV